MMARAIAMLWAGLLIGCTIIIDMDEGALCDGPDQCPTGYRCINDRCKESGPACGDHVVDERELCDDGNTEDGDGCSSNCKSDQVCGNGVVDEPVGEACDEGALNGTYGHCNDECDRVVFCGDGTIDSPNEICDDGADNGLYDHCRGDCQGMGPFCGDGNLDEPYETCERGDGDPCEPCALDCSGFSDTPICGDGQRCIDQEECDDGYQDDCGTCNAVCSRLGSGSTCGDGAVCPEFEACDDGYTDECGTCNAECTGEGSGAGTCGDGQWCPETENCDDGFQDGCGDCNSTCTGAGAGPGECGDGDWCAQYEHCDDGFEDDCGDCNATCGGDGSGPGTCGDGDWCPQYELCDDGTDNGKVSTTDPYCTPLCDGTQICGNAIPEGSETCDDAEQGGECLDDCSGYQTCGDGVVGDNEACDDGNQVNGDACSEDCSAFHEFMVSDSTAGYDTLAHVAAAPDGFFVVVWRNGGPTAENHLILAQRFSAKGGPLGGPIQISDDSSGQNHVRPRVGVAADHSFVVAWNRADPVSTAPQ
ncbi:DUF4215 domain-containing protein, partial [Myxococcota bacterium]